MINMMQKCYIFVFLSLLSFSAFAQSEVADVSDTINSHYVDSLYCKGMNLLRAFSGDIITEDGMTDPYHEIVSTFTSAAELGHTESAIMTVKVLIQYYKTASFIKSKASGILNDKLTARSWWALQEAKRIIRIQERNNKIYDNSELLYLYGYIYEKEDHNYKKSCWFYQRSAEKGYPPAFFRLSLKYRDGRYVPQNITLALKMLQKACESGYIEACGLIDNHYQIGILKSRLSEIHDSIASPLTDMDIVQDSIVSIDTSGWTKAESWFQNGLALYDETPIINDTLDYLSNVYEKSLNWFEMAANENHIGAIKEAIKIRLSRRLFSVDNMMEHFLVRRLILHLDLQKDGEAMFLYSIFLLEAGNDSSLVYLQRSADMDYAPAVYYLAEAYYWGAYNLVQDLNKYRALQVKACELGYSKACHTNDHNCGTELNASINDNTYENIVKSIFEYYKHQE